MIGTFSEWTWIGFSSLEDPPLILHRGFKNRAIGDSTFEEEEEEEEEEQEQQQQQQPCRQQQQVFCSICLGYVLLHSCLGCNT